MQEPDTKYFRDIFENSLSTEQQSNFYQDFLKLLSYNNKKHRDKVAYLVGDANSSKTSLIVSNPGPSALQKPCNGD